MSFTDDLKMAKVTPIYKKVNAVIPEIIDRYQFFPLYLKLLKNMLHHNFVTFFKHSTYYKRISLVSDSITHVKLPLLS